MQPKGAWGKFKKQVGVMGWALEIPSPSFIAFLSSNESKSPGTQCAQEPEGDGGL